MLGLVVVGVLFFRIVTSVILRRDHNAFGDERLREARASLDFPALTEQPAVVLVGTSNIEAGIDPRIVQSVLDRDRHLEVWNYGVGGLTSLNWRLFGERIAERFERAHAKAALTVVEFCPFQFTFAAKKRNDVDAVDRDLAQVGGPSDFAAASISLERKARVASLRYLLGGVPSSAVTGWAAAEWRKATGHRDELGRASDVLHAAFAEVDPSAAAHVRGWPAQSHGYVTLCDLAPKACDEYYAIVRKPEHLKASLARYEDCCDIVQLRFDREQIDEFLELVRRFQQISTKVALVVMPQHVALRRPDDAVDRLHAMLREVEARAGVPMIDLSNPAEISADDFKDVTHVNPTTGAPKLSALFAERVRELVR
jgi:hypothetical protein